MTTIGAGVDGAADRQRFSVLVNGVDARAASRVYVAPIHAHDAREHRDLEPLSRSTNRDVRRASAERFGEALNVFEGRSDLLSVEIDRRSTETNQIE